MKLTTLIAATITLSLLSACGGGSSTSTAASPVNTAAPVPAVIPAPGTVANICTADGEKSWVRAHLNDVYLWYREIVDLPAANYATPDAYFQALLVKPKDRFSFTEDQSAADGFFETGEDVGYGLNLIRDADHAIRVSYAEPNSPAADNGIGRGTTIVKINGVAEADLSRTDRNAALYPSASGQTNQFDVLDAGSSATRSVTLSARPITLVPVPQAKVITTADHKKVGYLVFNEHIATAGPQLSNAIASFQSAGINELVLDVRYNGGGYLYIARELASMIGGIGVQGQIFSKLQNNDKHANLDITDYFSILDNNNRTLPQLGMNRVFVLTSANTCSASEAVINGLAPFVNVITIGSASCGKPYGMRQTNNCGIAYFAISFQDTNSAGQLVPTTGYAPACAAADNVDQQLGDPNENLLAAALKYQATGACPTAAARTPLLRRSDAVQAEDLTRTPWRNNLFLK